MREFGADYLFRVSVELKEGYFYREKRKKPYYVVAASKSDAKDYVNRHLTDGWKIKSVSLLAEQYGGRLFGSD